ncbi:MAG: class I SAM-dependent methyltransferase [Erysipelotrichaceae bacterium]|nr:class I SAM-dependent methyltransferase [Erysipelotrichaceae bacterium]
MIRDIRSFIKKGHSWSSDTPTPVVLNTLQKYSVSKDSFILEIGCGEGRDAFRLLDEGYNVMASDISSEAINYCRSLRPEYSDHFSVLDCINDHHGQHYDFIYSVAVIHMLVSDEDRIRFYHFIYDHLLDGGLALICSMGDGLTESETDISSAFNMVERHHESGFVKVPSTSLRMVSFDTFENEIISNNLSIIEKGITPSLPDFNNLMYAVIRKHE